MSMIEGTHNQPNGTVVVAVDAWARLLADESVRLHSLGIRAGLISIDCSSASDPSLWRDRAVRLLQRALRPTDRIGITSDASIAVLQAPLQTLTELERMASQIDVHLRGVGLTAAIGYAHRRTGEPLVDTFARADAQADRAAFRRELASGKGLLLS